MEQRRFGPTKHEVPVVGQGTWYIDSGDRPSTIAALRRGLDLGMTQIAREDRGLACFPCCRPELARAAGGLALADPRVDVRDSSLGDP